MIINRSIDDRIRWGDDKLCSKECKIGQIWMDGVKGTEQLQFRFAQAAAL